MVCKTPEEEQGAESVVRFTACSQGRLPVQAGGGEGLSTLGDSGMTTPEALLDKWFISHLGNISRYLG